ncbi:MAG: hypothetical protein R3B47_12665 [Bacteroidia bacterium]
MITFERDMDSSLSPQFSFPLEDPSNTISFNADSSGWVNAYTYFAAYDVAVSSEVIDSVDFRIEAGMDEDSIVQEPFVAADLFYIETEKPDVQALTANDIQLSLADTGQAALRLILIFSEPMRQSGMPLSFPVENPLAKSLSLDTANTFWINSMYFQATYHLADSSETLTDIDVRISGLKDLAGNPLDTTDYPDAFSIDTEKPLVSSLSPNVQVVSDPDTGSATFRLRIQFGEAMDRFSLPVVSFPNENPLANSLIPNPANSRWIAPEVWEAAFDVVDANETLDNIDVQVAMAFDAFQNPMDTFTVVDVFHIDSENPMVTALAAGTDTIRIEDAGLATFQLLFSFSEDMDQNSIPVADFPAENPLSISLSLNTDSSRWLDPTTFEARYDVSDSANSLMDIDVGLALATDLAQNNLLPFVQPDVFNIDIRDTTTVGIEETLANGSDGVRVSQPVVPGQSP